MNKQPHLQGKWLMVRMDRIGDLVLTMPVDSLVYEGGHQPVQWWIPKGLGFIAKFAVPPRTARELARNISLRDFLALVREVKKQNYAGAVIFHAPWWVSAALWLARVPIRVGVRSQWYSFFFFNRGVRQKRSQAEHSELEYGYRLLESAMELPAEATREHLHLQSPGDRAQAQEILSRMTDSRSSRAYVVVHPGMGGSALNWPNESYAELIRELSHTVDVVITGTASDEKFLQPLRQELGRSGGVIWTDGRIDSAELLTILAAAQAVVAPSTGVIHLAASLGVKTIGIYSPVRVQHPRRWGPIGRSVIVHLPDVDCPGQLACLGPACGKFNCIQKIRVEDVLKSVLTESKEVK